MKAIQGLQNAFASKFKQSFRNYIFSKDEYNGLERSMRMLIKKEVEEAKKEGFDAARESKEKTYDDYKKSQ